MNDWQVARQLKSLLADATWPDGAQEKVFAKVLVSAGASARGMGQLGFPFAAVVPQDGTVDDDDPRLWLSTLEVTLVARVAGDPWGESVLIGGPRGAAGQGSSQGRGLVELEEELKKTVRFLGASSGIRIRVLMRTAIAAVEVEELGYVASRAYKFSALTSDERSYPAPTRFTATDAAGAGDVDLAWSLPPDRYDRYALVLRRAAGATAPASPTAGDAVAVGPLVTYLTDSPGAGEFSYALFMGYDELNDPPSSSDRWSSGVTATVTAT